MKKKHFYIIRAICFGTLSLFLFIIPFVFGNNKDIDLTVLIVLMAITFAFFTYQAIKKSKQSGKVEISNYAPPEDAPPKEQIKFYSRFIIISIIAFSLLTIIIYTDLNDLQSGTVESVRIWAPVAFLYNQFGYLTALLSVPILGLLSIFGFGKKIYTINKDYKNN
jgi:amino acid transporter